MAMKRPCQVSFTSIRPHISLPTQLINKEIVGNVKNALVHICLRRFCPVGQIVQLSMKLLTVSYCVSCLPSVSRAHLLLVIFFWMYIVIGYVIKFLFHYWRCQHLRYILKHYVAYASACHTASVHLASSLPPCLRIHRPSSLPIVAVRASLVLLYAGLNCSWLCMWSWV